MGLDIKNIISGKVRVTPNGSGDIWDEDNNHIADARGWGRFQYQEDGDKKHDFLAKFIVDAINEKLDRLENGEPPRAIVIVSDDSLVGEDLAKMVESGKIEVRDHLPPEEIKKEIKISPPPSMEQLKVLSQLNDKRHKSKKKRGRFGNNKKYF